MKINFKLKKKMKHKNNVGENFSTNQNKFNIVKFFPTFISLLAVCCGIASIRYAYLGKFIYSVTLILIACFLDGIDGRVARFFHASSDFGAEIDSLADVINFGVAPAFVVYCWKVNEMLSFPVAYWTILLLLPCCMAIRLARFNVDRTTKDHNDPLIKYFFVGMPAPAVAAMCIWPLVLNFEFGQFGFWNSPCYVFFNTVILAIFAVSRIPTPCFKKVQIPLKLKNIILLLSMIYIILLFANPWLGLSVLGLLYIVSIIIGLFIYNNFKKAKKDLFAE